MSNKTARRRYLAWFVPSMIAYMASIFLASFVISKGQSPDVISVGLAILPAVFVCIWMGAHIRYILEIDEFLRRVQIEAVLYGLIAVMTAATVWGLLELYLNVPSVPLFYVVPFYYVSYGLAGLYLSRKHETGCAML